MARIPLSLGMNYVIYWVMVILKWYKQGQIYYEANEASASSPHHLGGPHQNFNAVSKVDFFIASKIFES